MTSHRGQHIVPCALQHGVRFVLRQLGQHTAGQSHRVALRQRGRYAPHHQRLRRQRGQLQAQLGQHACMAFSCGHLFGRGRKGRGNQQRLALQMVLRELCFQAFIDDAFVRSMHVHHHQALLVFSQDVNALQLRQGFAQRPFASRQGLCFGVLGGCSILAWRWFAGRPKCAQIIHHMTCAAPRQASLKR